MKVDGLGSFHVNMAGNNKNLQEIDISHVSPKENIIHFLHPLSLGLYHPLS